MKVVIKMQRDDSMLTLWVDLDNLTAYITGKEVTMWNDKDKNNYSIIQINIPLSEVISTEEWSTTEVKFQVRRHFNSNDYVG